MGRGQGQLARTELKPGVTQRTSPTPDSGGADARLTTFTAFRQDPKPYCVIDLETTGLEAADNRIWEIGIVCYDAQGREERRYRALINPERAVPDNILALCHVTQAEIDQGRPAADVFAEVADILADRVVATYNAKFDVPFLDQEGRRLGYAEPLVKSFFCALTATRTFLPGRPGYRLVDIATSLHVPLDHAHHADADAAAAGQVLLQLKDRSSRFGNDPAGEYVVGELFDRLFTWRETAYHRLNTRLPKWVVFNNKEIGDIAQAGAEHWRKPGFSLRAIARSVGARDRLPQRVTRDPADPGRYDVDPGAGQPAYTVRLDVPECAICGRPASDNAPCRHLVGAARRFVLDELLSALADDVGHAPKGAPKAA